MKAQASLDHDHTTSRSQLPGSVRPSEVAPSIVLFNEAVGYPAAAPGAGRCAPPTQREEGRKSDGEAEDDEDEKDHGRVPDSHPLSSSQPQSRSQAQAQVPAPNPPQQEPARTKEKTKKKKSARPHTERSTPLPADQRSISTVREPHVYVHEGEKRRLENWTLEAPRIEVGGSMFGGWNNAGEPIVQLITRSDVVSRSEVFVTMDLDKFARVQEYMYREHGLVFLGEWHSHHTLGIHHPSHGDIRSVTKILQANRSMPAFFIVVAYILGAEVHTPFASSLSLHLFHPFPIP